MLKQVFIKNYKDTENPEVRNKYGKVAGIFGIISNLILGIIKLIIGFISNSVSIMADAVNNLSDMLSSLLTIVGFKLASRKPNHEHPYGYARYEYVSGFAIAILMLIMGLVFAKESVIKIIHPEELVINNITFLILFIAIVGKACQMFVYMDFSKAIDSNTLKTNAIDTRNDIISTTAILISMLIMKKFNINIDGYLGLVVSIFVIYSSIQMVKEVLEPIIGIIPTKERVDEITQRILSYDYVQGIHDLVIHNYGVHNDFVTVHVEIDSKMDMLEAHDLMDNIENDFRENLGISLTIHMDPVVIGNEKVDKLKQLIVSTIHKLDNSLEIHDFRIVEGTTHTNILFDCVVPYEKDYTADYIKEYLNNNIEPEEEKYYYVVEIDRPYC
ncbi:MAG: cation transporter [Clostridia bacterium]|nr:cation transporter [Clostridia bacterium]